MKIWKNWKSKKTLRVEAEEYLRLWLDAERDGREADAHNGELLGLVEQIEYPRTLVLAPNLHLGAMACERMGVRPRGRDTLIISTERALQGLRVKRGDRVIFVGNWHQPGTHMTQMWKLVLSRSGLTHADLWVSHQ